MFLGGQCYYKCLQFTMDNGVNQISNMQIRHLLNKQIQLPRQLSITFHTVKQTKFVKFRP